MTLRLRFHCLLGQLVPILMWLLVCLATHATAADENFDLKKMANLPVLVKDEQGNPIAGARVMPYAMRMKEQEGHGYWNQKLFGPPKTVTSDQTGVAVIQYPIHVESGPRVLTTRLVTFQVTHTDFVRSVVDFELEARQAEVTLKAGCEVQLTAIDAKGNPIDDFGVVMAGPYQPDAWAKAEEGGRRTRSINDGSWQTMLVKIQDNGPTLFSGIQPLRVQPQQTIRIRNVRLTPGARVHGKLSDNVPRPVHGYVIAVSAPKPAGDSWNDKDPSLVWHDWVEVAPDGSFEFQSLPRGGQLQVIGICEGWISSTSVPEARGFVMGQLFEVGHDRVDIELAMEPTGTLEVKLVTEEGKPFTEGRVESWPNQRYFKGGSTLLGQRYRSETQVRNQLLRPDQQLPIINVDLAFPFHQLVGKDGVAKLTGLPIGRQQSVCLLHDRFKLATDNPDENPAEVLFGLSSPQPIRKEITVKSEKK